MEIYVEKFGGASVNSASAVKNVFSILQKTNNKRVVVISAMGKTTNKLENIVNLWYKEKSFNEEQFKDLYDYHKGIIKELFYENSDIYLRHIDGLFIDLRNKINSIDNDNYDFLYDSVVSYGERISTYIVSSFLNYAGLKNKLVQSSSFVKTDNNYRSANVLWEETKKKTNENILPLFDQTSIIITQGFVGGTIENLATTLGREGSDYSASIIAYCLNARQMTIWKDVEGLLNCDPKRMPNSTKILQIPYSEAIELSYYGASIIHPKTIKPLENANIPLYIKSFLNPDNEGSLICKDKAIKPIVANFIFKDNQTLLSISPKDMSFIDEKNLSLIYSILFKHKIKVNIMQNSAISFSLCFDRNDNIFKELMQDLQNEFMVRYNNGLQLITIRHYTQQAIKEVVGKRKIIIEQKSRITAQYLINEK
ncbi:MAG: aspartate kinase [Bacteroidales bacterium]|jgi:aspartate kinase|nr:aspartate kinase [Bacteroidales bacterium]